jgi:hypothetical protein
MSKGKKKKAFSKPEPVLKKTITGRVYLQKQKPHGYKCRCCDCKDGSHVFSVGVNWRNHYSMFRGLEDEKEDAEGLVSQLIHQNNYDFIEGKRVRLTIEVID